MNTQDFTWVAVFNHADNGVKSTDVNSTRYYRYFHNHFDACIWLNEHKQHWNTGHRVLSV